MTWELREQDAFDGLTELAPQSLASLLSDVPSGIAFLGEAWDDFRRYEPRSDLGERARSGGLLFRLEPWEYGFVAFLADVLGRALPTLKPGAHGAIWALPRTAHLTGMALRLAGFEVRDSVHHLFSVGMAKGLDVGKVLGEEWEGFGSALAPAHEVWLLVRRPLDGTIRGNVAAHGTGALNIDGTRLPRDPGEKTSYGPKLAEDGMPCGAGYKGTMGRRSPYDASRGRWPKNAVFSHADACEPGRPCAHGCVVRTLDLQSGITKSARSRAEHKGYDGESRTGFIRGRSSPGNQYDDEGGASRLFHCFYASKAPPGERLAGVEDETPHPTVKGVGLMRWLARLVTPPGGRILDCFAGTGSTGVGALAEGFGFLGYEKAPGSAAIARRRLAYAASHPHDPILLGAGRGPEDGEAQLDLFS